MPAKSENFPWPSYYGHFHFYEQRMQEHGRVKSVSSVSDGLYVVETVAGASLRVFICECYSFGVAEYCEVKNNIDGIDIIIINSSWCGYTPGAKKQCRNDQVGLFNIGEFMAALYRDEVWSYLDEKEA